MNPSVINRDRYLVHALTFKPEEYALRTAACSWLPSDIIDAHAHSNTATHVLDMPEKAYRHMLSSFPYFTLEESALVHDLMYPGKKVRSLRFPKTFHGIDQKQANAYLLSESPKEDRVALFGLPEDIAYTRDMLAHERVSALKMYYSYVNPTATLIYECFPPEILERAQELDVPVVLHLPRVITKSQDDLDQLLRDFPRLRVILAHLGLLKFAIPGLREAYQRFSGNKNVYLDTALNPSAEVASLAIEVFGWNRIIFGSDEPLNLLRTMPYTNPTLGERLVTDFPYHWADPKEQSQYGNLAQSLFHAQWQQLEAIRIALETLPEAERAAAKNAMFNENAKRIYGF